MLYKTLPGLVFVVGIKITYRIAHPCSALILTGVCSFPPREHTTVYSFALSSMHRRLGCMFCYREQCCWEQTFIYVCCVISTSLDVVDLLGHGIKEWPTIWVNASVSKLFASLMLTAGILWIQTPSNSLYFFANQMGISLHIIASCFMFPDHQWGQVSPHVFIDHRWFFY